MAFSGVVAKSGAGGNGGLPRRSSEESEIDIPIELRCTDTGESWKLLHRVRVVPHDRPVVLYSGFLGCPISSRDDLEIVVIPANYAIRKPHVLTEILDIADLLPLEMEHRIAHAARVEVMEAGIDSFGDVPWESIPPFDYNAAKLREGARLLTQTDRGDPLIAEHRVGDGTVIAVAIDCFGFESYVEGLSFDWWPGKPRMIRSALDRLLET